MMPFANFDRFVTGELLAPVRMSLPMLAVWLAAALGIGALALRGRNFRSLWLEFVLGVAVMAWSAVFLSSFLLRLPAWLLPLLSAPAAGYGILHLLRRVQAVKREGVAFPVLFCAAVAAFALFTFASALFPPYGWDEQVYQTALLRRCLAEGNAAVRMDNPYSAYPSLPHFALMWAADAAGVEFPRLVTWALLVLFLAAFYRELSLRYAALPAATATLAVVLSPLVLAAGREFYTDLWTACFALAGALVLLPRAGEGALRAEDVPERRARFFAAGVFAASAVSVKLPGGGAALALAVLAFGAFPGGSGRGFGWFLFGGAAAALPFFLRVWLATGDPFYPWGAVLTGDAVAAQVAEFHRQLGRYRYGLEGVPGVALGWIFAAFDAKLYDGIAVGWQLPALLLIAFGGWILRRREISAPPFRTRSDFAAAAMLTLYLFWSLTSQQSRFLLPLLVAAAWGSAAVLASPGWRKRRRRILAGTVLILSLAGSSLPAAYHYVVAWRRCAAARREPAMHLAAAMRDPGYVAAMNELAKLPADSRVLMLGERRTLYARPRCVLGDPLFQGERFTPPPGSAEEFAAGLKGFDYLYLGSSPVEIDRLEQYEQLRRSMEEFTVELLRRGDLRMVFSSGGNHLLEIRTRIPRAQRAGGQKKGAVKKSFPRTR